MNESRQDDNIIDAPRPDTMRRPKSARYSLYHNRLPPWILKSPEYATYSAGERHTLQGIANAADNAKRDPAGNLLGAFGGQKLIAKCGTSTPTFWRHVRKFEAAGHVVLISRGGPCHSSGWLANVWAIPATRGALHGERVQR